MQPIAIYRERILGVMSRTFTLFPDRVVVTGLAPLGAKFESPVSLVDLRPDYGKVWPRTLHFRLSIFALLMLSPIVTVQFFSSSWPPFRIGFLFVYALAILYFLANVRRIEYAQFRNDAGVVLLDMGRVGPQKEDYGSFVDLLVQHILAARNQGIAAQQEHGR